MNKINLYYPIGLENIWHQSADGKTKYRLDVVEKLVRLKNHLQKDDLFNIIEVKADSINDLYLVHDKEYIDSLLTGIPKELANSSGLMWQDGLVNVFANSSHALFLAMKDSLEGSQTGVIASGGHHAISGRGFGFNPISEIAICIAKIKKLIPSIKIAVIDLDVHLGNGLQEVLANQENTLVFDLWAKTNPKWGQPKKAPNVYSYTTEDINQYFVYLKDIIQKTNNFNPDLVIYHSGMDIFEKDRMGGIAGFDESNITEREKLIIESFKKKLVLVTGGGYIDRTNPLNVEESMQKVVDLYANSFALLS